MPFKNKALPGGAKENHWMGLGAFFKGIFDEKINSI